MNAVAERYNNRDLPNTLPDGARLGPYEIVGLLGAGGMGEVYRARDPRLGRTVAIKILPSEFSADANRAWRFEREARAVASLNHPNICTVHDIGDHEGHRYLVMEMMEGQPLDHRLNAGPLPLPQLLDLAVQIADALEAAHAAGVIHRDLKPANIFITRRGEAKLLDFGLAKLADAGETDATHLTSATGSDHSPTTVSPGGRTTYGSLLGTAAYMSPEQARGETVTAASDLFSFGVVLYEMATGRPAFTGNTTAVLFDAILNRQPPPITVLNPALPAELSRIVERALEKEPDLRYQSAADMRADLKRVRRDSSAGRLSDSGTRVPAPSTVTAPPTPLPPPSSGVPPSAPSGPASSTSGMDNPVVGAVKSKRNRRLLILAVVLGGFAIRNAFRDSPGDTARRDVARRRGSLDAMQVTQLTTTGNAGRAALSSDGKYVVYLQFENDGSAGVWLRQTEETSSVKIMAADPSAGPILAATIGPDSSFVDVLRGRQLFRVPFLGGAPKLILDRVSMPVGWSPDGTHMAFVRGTSGSTPSQLVIASRDGAAERVLAERAFPAAFVTVSLAGAAPVPPAWSPDGERVAVIQRLGEDVRDMGIAVFDVSDGDVEIVKVRGDVPQGVGWLDEDTLVLGQALEQGEPSQLWRVTFPDGERSRLTNDVNRYAELSLSADGNSLVTSRPETRIGLWVGNAEGVGREVLAPAIFLSAAPQYATVGWDGGQVVFTHTLNGAFEIFRIDPDSKGGTTPQSITPGRDMATDANGTVVYRSISGDDVGLWKVDRDGRNRSQLAQGSVIFPSITPDGKNVIYSSPSGGEQSVWEVPLAGGTPTRVVDENVGAMSFSDVSPDGRSIALVLGNAWTICDLPACDHRRPIAIRGSRPRWTRDGRAITYVEPNGHNLFAQPIDGAPARQITRFDDGGVIGGYAWSTDGHRLAVTRGTFSSDIVLFRGLKTTR